MPYGCRIDSLLAVLETKCLRKVTALRTLMHECEFGLLSVGLKIHLTELSKGFEELVMLLGGTQRVLEQNVYRHIDAYACLVLPPLANAEAAILLLECMEDFTETRIFGNPLVQLQICSPGRLGNTGAALLAIAFYLGSDTLRRYRLQDLHTTVSGNDRYGRGKRILLYDAGGDFNRTMPWWEKRTHSKNLLSFVWRLMPNPLGVRVCRKLPFWNERTDVLGGATSRMDIRNVNLAATLITHASFQHIGGYWLEHGERFIEEMRVILEEHHLLGLLKAEWVLTDSGNSFRNQELFAAMLDELVEYAFAEAKRIHKERELGDTVRLSILDEVQDCLARFRGAIVSRVKGAEGGRR